MASFDAPEAERALLDIALSGARSEQVRRAAANALWERGGPLVQSYLQRLDALRDHPTSEGSEG
jgi:hypothetical protein